MTEYQVSSKVITMKLQALRQDFEMMHMKGNENVQPFISRMIIIVNQMKSYGDHISESTIVAKVLQSLTPLFDHVLMVIEESKDLTTLSVEELSGSLQAHEVRINLFV